MSLRVVILSNFHAIFIDIGQIVETEFRLHWPTSSKIRPMQCIRSCKKSDFQSKQFGVGDSFARGHPKSHRRW